MPIGRGVTIPETIDKDGNMTPMDTWSGSTFVSAIVVGGDMYMRPEDVRELDRRLALHAQKIEDEKDDHYL